MQSNCFSQVNNTLTALQNYLYLGSIWCSMLRVSMQVKASPGTDKNFCAKPKPPWKRPPFLHPSGGEDKAPRAPPKLVPSGCGGKVAGGGGNFRLSRRLQHCSPGSSWPWGGGGGCPKEEEADDVRGGSLFRGASFGASKMYSPIPPNLLYCTWG